MDLWNTLKSDLLQAMLERADQARAVEVKRHKDQKENKRRRSFNAGDTLSSADNIVLLDPCWNLPAEVLLPQTQGCGPPSIRKAGWRHLETPVRDVSHGFAARACWPASFLSRPGRL